MRDDESAHVGIDDPKTGEFIALADVCLIQDAHLIAAAPEMLVALKRIASITGSTGNAQTLVDEFKHIATVAIAKAEGKE